VTLFFAWEVAVIAALLAAFFLGAAKELLWWGFGRQEMALRCWAVVRDFIIPHGPGLLERVIRKAVRAGEATAWFVLQLREVPWRGLLFRILRPKEWRRILERLEAIKS